MRKHFLWGVLVGTVILAGPVRASYSQDLSLMEIYAGGGFGASRYFDRSVSPAFSLGLGLNLSDRIQLAAEFSSQYEGAPQIDFQGQPARFRQYQLLFGPQISFLRRRHRPFVYTLFGISARHLATQGNVLATDFGPAVSFGGGLDMSLREWLKIRVIQADYLLTNLAPDRPELSPVTGQLPPASTWQHHARLSAGFVFTLN